MQRTGTREQARGVRGWLRVMGAASLLTVAVSVLPLVSYYESVSLRLSIDESYFFVLSFLASGIVALLALSSLSLATAASLRSAADARRHATEDGPSIAAPPASAAVPAGTATMREWLMAVGLLCLLPPLVLVVHAGITRTVVDWGYTYFLGAIAVALVTLTCLCFGFARSLHECSRLADRSEVARQRVTASPLEGNADSQGSMSREREEVSPEKWLVVMGGICLLAAPISGYCLLMSTWFYIAFPRWSLVALAWAGGDGVRAARALLCIVCGGPDSPPA